MFLIKFWDQSESSGSAKVLLGAAALKTGFVFNLARLDSQLGLSLFLLDFLFGVNELPVMEDSALMLHAFISQANSRKVHLR